MRLVKKSQVNTGQSEIGNLQLLNTTTKATLVDAINELQAGGGGGTVLTDNGVSGDGTQFNPIVFGGAPLSQSTNLVLAGNILNITDNFEGDTFFLQYVASDFQVSTSGAAFETILNLQGNASTGRGAYFAQLSVVDIGAGHQKAIFIGANANQGIGIIDSMDNMGLVGAALYTNANNLQFAQYGNILASGTPTTFASLPSPPSNGMIRAVTDSSVNTWGTTITGGGANHVIAHYNGSNWTVIGK